MFFYDMVADDDDNDCDCGVDDGTFIQLLCLFWGGKYFERQRKKKGKKKFPNYWYFTDSF